MANPLSHASAAPTAASSAPASASTAPDRAAAARRAPGAGAPLARTARGLARPGTPANTAAQVARRALAHVEREWGEGEQPRPAAAASVLQAHEELAHRFSSIARRELSPLAAKSIAAGLLMAHPVQAQALFAQLASAGALSVEAQHEILRALRPASSMARPRARRVLEQRLPDGVALFLAKMQLERDKAVSELLKSWGESLRKWAELDRQSSERAHREASQRARQLEAGLLAKLRLVPSVALRIDGPTLRRILGPTPFGGPVAVESIGPSMLGAELISPPANRLIMGAFVQPKVFLGFSVGRSQSEYFYAVAERAAQVTAW